MFFGDPKNSAHWIVNSVRWRFAPAVRESQPVASEVVLPTPAEPCNAKKVVTIEALGGMLSPQESKMEMLVSFLASSEAFPLQCE